MQARCAWQALGAWPTVYGCNEATVTLSSFADRWHQAKPDKTCKAHAHLSRDRLRAHLKPNTPSTQRFSILMPELSARKAMIMKA